MRIGLEFWKNMRKATKKATQQAIKKATQHTKIQAKSLATWKITQDGTLPASNNIVAPALNRTVITVGSFTFAVHHEEPSDHAALTSPPTKQETHLPPPTSTISKPHEQILKAQIEKDKKEVIEASPTQKTHNITQRFIRASPATEEWQTAVNKRNHKKKVQHCSYCQREGHINSFCWKKKKCYNCGKLGHISARCFFKPAPIRPLTKSQPKNPYKTIPIMDDIQGRPNLGDVFCPPRYGLDDDNGYLARVGLLILITGAPSPDLPGLIAAKLASVHGGHSNNYAVAQTAITPYIITCTTTRSRDAIVQGEIYSIPQRHVRFTVHEWRPRFGLGYDLSTYQVWVRLVGLPLQTWTTREITAFLQKFGHPIQILPYGQEAGHYRDITALVNTNHPRKIPLAYKYREGDYSTQVEVIILTWREWMPGHYPPSEDQQNHMTPARLRLGGAKVPTQWLQLETPRLLLQTTDCLSQQSFSRAGRLEAIS